MDVYLHRNGRGKEPEDKATIGDFIVNGISVLSLEDDYDLVKLYEHTRIPAGRYEIKLKNRGGHNVRYSERFKGMHLGMLHLQDVPGYTDILIHCGNTPKDTAGCILVGLHEIRSDMISDSVTAYKMIYPVIAKELEAGKRVFINILD